MFKLTETDLWNLAEDVDLEAKKATGRDGRGELPRSFFETYSAMANTNGGIILLGIEEKPEGIFTAVGIPEPEPVLKALWDSLNNRDQVSINLLAEHMVQVKDFQGKNVIQVSVPRARRNQRPVYKGINPFDGTYRRNYEGDYLCDYETVRRIISDKGEDSRDATLLDDFDFNDLDEDTLKAYRNQFKATKPDHPWLDQDNVAFLRSIGGWTTDRDTKKEGLTLAGLLMFGKLRSILDAVPNYVVDYQERPMDVNETRWTDRITIDGMWSGNLYDFYRLTRQRLFRELKVPFKLEETRRIDDTPVHEALREALINTLIHADYSGRIPILVVKGPDVFLFRNSGTMRLSLEDVLRGGVSDCRNRNLQKMFQLIGYGEQAGSGVPRIYRNWKQQLWRSPYLSERFDPDIIELTLRMVSLIPEEVLLELDGRFGATFRRLSELQRLALATAVIEGTMTHARLKSMTSAHPHDITMALSALVKDGFLDSYGATRGTFYILAGESPEMEEGLLRHRLAQLPVPPKPEQAGDDSELLQPSSEYLGPDSELLEASSEYLKQLEQIARAVKEKGKVPKDVMEGTILSICKDYFINLRVLADLTNRSSDSLRINYLNRMVKEGQLELRYPDKPTHPNQGYRTKRPGLRAESKDLKGMQPLEKTLRGKLERTVREAREIAEAAARASLEQLGVSEINPPSHLNEDERKLRVKLRAHGRQLGDDRDSYGQQETLRLVEEVAYQHWHRMLFARFLAENNLLMYPDPVEPIPVTLEECEDLATEEGAKNGWELAARFAAKMLPQIFRLDSPVFQITLPPERQQKLEQLLAELPPEVFLASDSLGWVYQFWQAKKKDEIDASGVKIGARELPVVTQLFTEPYMVHFLLDNSLGAWWAAQRLSETDLRDAKDENELRQRASLPGMTLDYLRFVQGEDGRWSPAAGTFDGWPESLSELKALDPCTGSGHFLVAALSMLVPMRMEQEGLSAQEAVDAVLRENLHGLEIDPRCVELAAFALALAAWRYPDTGGYRQLPELNLACSGLSISAKKEEWIKIAGEDVNLQIALEDLYDQFEKAPILGSLINPKTRLSKSNLLGLQWKDVAPLLTKAISKEQDYESKEMGVVAQGISRAAQMMTIKYHLVLTNVPYLTRGKQNNELKEFCEKQYPVAKNDLATVFLDRCLEFCTEAGTANVVIPQNWLFLTSYKKFRERLLIENPWHIIGRLGFAAFDIMDWWAFNTTLISIGQKTKTNPNGLFICQEKANINFISGIDADKTRQPAEKAIFLRTAEIRRVEQAKQLENPDARVSFFSYDIEELIGKYAETGSGLSTFDRARFVAFFWEIFDRIDKWELSQSSVNETKFYGGCEYAILWENGKGQLFQQMEDKRQLGGYTSGVWRAGSQFWGKKGVLISLMNNLPASLYCGGPYDQNVGLITPNDDSFLSTLWAFCSSTEFNVAVRQVDQALKVTNATMGKIPIDWKRWQNVAAEKYPNGLPKPYSDDPTQWIFHGHLAQSEHPLQVAIARLLGYRWPAELDPEMDLSDEARSLVKRCDDLLYFADDDGIVCIPPVRGEASAADCLLNLLAAAYGDAWSTDKLSELLKQADHAGKTLETWLRDKFFIQHCKLFHHRPFIWHIWDGLPDGFAALVNYHKLDAKLLESLIYVYLGDWISHQKDDIRNGVDGAEEKLAAAEALKKRLELILEGEAPYDIFVRWKPIEKQPIGWNPDLNDGARLNIRPFMSVPDVGKKGAGVLRDKPNINWNKDRGKDVESAPWYHLFKGDRINGYHLNLFEKRTASRTNTEVGN